MRPGKSSLPKSDAREISLGLALGLLVCLGSLLLTHAVWGAGGELLWQDQFDVADKDITAGRVAVDREGVFVAGTSRNTAGNADWIVRAYEARTGALLWQDQFDLAGGDNSPLSIAVEGKRVFVVGFGTNAAGTLDWLVRVYNARNGTLLWQDQLDLAGGDDGANAIAVGKERVFVAGFGAPGPGLPADWLVRAYDAHNGTLLWQDQFDLVGDGNFAFAIAVRGERVFAAGRSHTIPNSDTSVVIVRAYEVETGALLWQAQSGTGLPGLHTANAVAIADRRVFIAGLFLGTSGFNFLVEGYEAERGALLWQDLFSQGFEAFDIAARGPRVFAVGGISSGVVRAYDARNGTLLWQDLFTLGGGTGASRVAVRGEQVFVAGDGRKASGDADWTVRVYNARIGSLLWQDQFDFTGRDDRVGDIAVRGERVFVAGFGTNAAGHRDWIVRAYEVR